MTSEITLGLKMDLRITAQDIREPIFAYYHELERYHENQKARQHGQALVTKTFRDGGTYWVTLSFPDLPDIFCLDERYNDLRGIPLGRSRQGSGVQSEKSRSGLMEARNFVNARWQGLRVFDFRSSYIGLKEVLGEKFSRNLNWRPDHPRLKPSKKLYKH